MTRRLVGACIGLVVFAVGIYLYCWYLAFELAPVLRRERMPSSMEVANVLLPFLFLWWWSQCVEVVTSYRVPAVLTFLFACAIGLVVLVVLLS